MTDNWPMKEWPAPPPPAPPEEPQPIAPPAPDPPTEGWWLDPDDPRRIRYHDGRAGLARRVWTVTRRADVAVSIALLAAGSDLASTAFAAGSVPRIGFYLLTVGLMVLFATLYCVPMTWAALRRPDDFTSRWDRIALGAIGVFFIVVLVLYIAGVNPNPGRFD